MNTVELIIKKRGGGELTSEELAYLIRGYVSGAIPDYQMSALLMAIYYKGMSDDETLWLTNEIIKSGATIDLSEVKDVKADKHSTGGVGDKTTLALCPMLAACGVKMAKMSGRGLGHTGGTIDKLESFPGLTVSLDRERFIRQVNEVGFVIAAQTEGIVPADKKLYALRDVTGTVDIIPLIVSSIMSKKLAAGTDIIVLDVKCGKGAFMKTEGDAFLLAEKMVRLGKNAGRKTVAVVSEMNEPLGYAVGNALEVKEAIELLKGSDCGGLGELCLTLGANVLTLAEIAPDEGAARGMLEEKIADGSALKKLAELVKAQGGDEGAAYDTSKLPAAPYTLELCAVRNGWITGLDAGGVGMTCIGLGGGRETKNSVIDPAVGVVLRKKTGDHIKKGEPLAVIHAKNPDEASCAAERLLDCYSFGDEKPQKSPFIKGIVQ